MSGWNQAPLPRDQILLFPETLGDRIPKDHSVRLLAEILDSLDWSNWQRHYVLVAGQPPIPPKIMAGAILYGLTHGLRSSRRHRVGLRARGRFQVAGRRTDHRLKTCRSGPQTRQLMNLPQTLVSGLRTRPTWLFRQIGRVAMHMGLIRLNQVALDGPRVKANSSPHATASAKTLAERQVVRQREPHGGRISWFRHDD